MHKAEFTQCHNSHLTKKNYSCIFVVSFELWMFIGYGTGKTEQKDSVLKITYACSILICLAETKQSTSVGLFWLQ